MPQILAIDTSTMACSVALLSNDTIKEEYQELAQSHTQCLLPMVDKLLGDHQLSLQALDAIALTIGPGSFTGLRIGLGVAQGLAFGADLPIVGLSSLAVMSHGAFRLLQLHDNDCVIPCLDARMQEVYWGCYNATGDVLSQDAVAVPELVLDFIAAQTTTLIGIGDGWNCIPASGSETKKVKRIDANFYPRAHDVAVLGERSLQRGLGCSALEIEPIYIRNTTPWKKRQKIRQS